MVETAQKHTPEITIRRTNDDKGFTWISATGGLRENGATFPTLEAAIRDAYEAHTGLPLAANVDRARNSHDELIAALKDVLADTEDRGITQATVNKVRAVLKATGEQQ